MGADEPLPLERVAPPLALADVAAGLPVLGIEVTQTVQDLANSVTLIADKTTVVRVYLDATALTPSTRTEIRGELAWRHEGGAEAFLPSLNGVLLDADDPSPINGQRRNLATGLNFRLPPDATIAGRLALRLSGLSAAGGERLSATGVTQLDAEFVANPSLMVRIVGLRYLAPDPAGGPQRAVSPEAVHFSYLRSYLQRAYPVSTVEWTQVVVDADFAAPFAGGTTTAMLANAQLVAMRSREVGAGGPAPFDPRTHYYGLVSDDAGRNFMRGWTSLENGEARPDLPGSGPAGTPNGYLGDTDASYADWYGAHEIGHSFGRHHPGFPPQQQTSGDPDFPYPQGQISTDDERYVGFDVGDPELGLPMAALPGTVFHDVMTYSPNQWPSAYTYEAIRVRLLSEAGPGEAGAPPPGPGQPGVRQIPTPGHFVHVVATLDLAAATGEIRYVNPSSLASPSGIGNDRGVSLRFVDAGGNLVLELEPRLLFRASEDPDTAELALVAQEVDVVPGMHEVLLLIDGQVRSRHVAGVMDPAVGEDFVTGAGLQSSPNRRTFTGVQNAQRDGVTYTAQARADASAPWQTVAVGRTGPDLEVDVNQFPAASRVEVRVLATNGFEDQQVATAEIVVGDLAR